MSFNRKAAFSARREVNGFCTVGAGADKMLIIEDMRNGARYEIPIRDGAILAADLRQSGVRNKAKD